MRFSSVLIEIAATPAYLFVTFCLLAAVLHLALVWLGSLSDIAWKRVDYIWLGAATIGLMGASGHADRYISEQLANNLEEPRTASAYRELRFFIEKAAEPSSAVCRDVMIRSELSPPEFDEIVHEQQLQCSYFKALIETIQSEVKPPFPSLADIGFTDYAGPLNHGSWYVMHTRKSAAEYTAQRQLYIDRKLSSEVSDLEVNITLLGPLLLCFALALRITKVSGEITNARRKEAQQSAAADAASRRG